MAKPIDMTGQNIGRWHIDSLAYVKGYDKYYNCTCDCGTKKIVLGQNIRHGKSLSCGCLDSQRTHDRCFKDRTGERYGFLTCTDKWEKRNSYIYWLCKCDCGNETWVRGINLSSGQVKSCGCKKFESHNVIHGMSHTKIHDIWSRMIDRCHNPNAYQYKWYGGEGKTVCDEWHGTDGFIRFYEWAVANGYTDGLSIERKDINKGYSPENCCWIPLSQQTWNTRISTRITLNGKEYTAPQLANKFNVPLHSIHYRLKAGWKPEQIVGLEPHKRGEKWATTN